MRDALLVIVIALLAIGCQSKDKEPTKKQTKQRPTRRVAVGTKRQLSAGDWRADLKLLAAELPKRHVNLFHTLKKADWEAKVADLDKQIPKLNQYQILAALSGLVASVGDGHTMLVRRRIKFLRLGLYWFSDGIHVRFVPRGHVWAIGRKLTHVDGKPIDQVIAALTKLIAHDNEQQLKWQMGNVLVDAHMLIGAGITKRADRATYTLADKAGKTKQLTVVLGQRLAAPLRPKTVPDYRRRTNLFYWNKYHAQDRLLYVQYNKCANARYMSFSKFATGVLDRIDKGAVDRLVIDLRRNGGGDSRIINPLLIGLEARRKRLGKGKLFVIIGRRTFSSAVLNTLQLQSRLDAILVGEPTGGKPSHYGEVKKLELPKSKMFVQYSTKLFTHPKQTGPYIEPDVKVATSYADYEAGRDPAMKAILAYKPNK